MTGKERIRTAMLGGKADRVPFMPQICFPHAVIQLETDYVKGIVRCMEDIRYRMELMLEITKLYHSDGFRILGAGSIPMKVVCTGDRHIVQRRDTGERLGVLDLKTGGIIGDEYPVKSIEDVEMISVPTVEEFVASEEFTLFREVCGWAGDFNKVGGISMALSHLVAARGAEQAMFDLYEEPELVEALLNKQLRIAVNRAKAMVSCGMDTLYIGDPWSSCSVISPQIFAQYSFPFFRRFVEELKPSGLTIYAHICGNVNPIIGQIVDTGVDCIEPMDPLGGVSPAEFRKRVDRRVALMGGVNTVTLSSGTPDDVRTEALACIEAAGKNGGYILAAGDMVPFEAPRENVLAMYEAAQSYRD